MKKPTIPDNEIERLHALKTLKILDSSQEERFDRITRMARRLFGVPISLVSLVDRDRQWFKSKQGIDASETPREISFCGHAINEDGLFIIPDATKDDRFEDNPLVTDDPNIRFYAGYPLKVRDGLKIGTLCLIDSEPREMDKEDRQLLKDLGVMIEQEIKSVQMATIDELTLISNRRGFLSLAEHTLKLACRKEMSTTLLLFDLNDFKSINDDYGHHEGDFALKKFSEILLNTLRECDIIGRWGGDEFVAFLTDTDSSKLKKILSRLKENIDKVNNDMNKPYKIKYSVGATYYAHDSKLSLEERVREADVEMYRDKKEKN